MVVLGGGGIKRIYAYRHFSRYLHMYRKGKENRKGGLS